MSNRNNDVFQVLVTKGNGAVLAKGNAVEALLPGQIGAFDANTNLSIDSTTPNLPKEFYFALGIDRTGSGTLEDIRTSAGQLIQRKGIRNFSFKPHTAGQPMVVTVGGYMPKCETEYGIRIEFRNSRIYRVQGFNQFSKAFLVTTPCCDECETGCSTTDANVLTRLMVAEINRDPKALVVAKPVARQAVTTATHGTSVNYAAGAVMTDADVLALITYNNLPTTTDAQKVFTNFTLTPAPLQIANFFQVNLHFHKLLETAIVTSLIQGFDCSGTTTQIQNIVYAEGTGVNIQQKEFHASGWNGAGPYVVSETTGLAKGNIEYLSSVTGTYDQFILEYNQTSESGWLEYENPLSTIFAVPEADTVTRASLATLLDYLLGGLNFETLADDAAQANANPAVVEPVVTDVTKDGLAN